MKRFLFFLLMATPMLAQTPPIAQPPVMFTDSVGPRGKFPFFNNGSITMSNADYTMQWPDFSASVIQVTGTLSGVHTLYAPATHFGFEFTIQNATSGGFAIVVKPEGNAAATGVTIPNGQAMMVIYNGVDYMSAGAPAAGPAGGGWGNIVPNPFATIQAAITAGGGPVVVLPSSTDQTAYQNLTNARIMNFKQSATGADSLFFRDVSEWGVIDGATISCSTTAGSTTITCSHTLVNAPAPAGDVGKLIIIDQAGLGTYGQVAGDMYVASTAPGFTPGPPGSIQGVTWTDAGDGCNTIDTMPYGHVWLDSNGLLSVGPANINGIDRITGKVDWTQNWYGKGCTHPPTTATIGSLGTANFTGGTMRPGDLVSVITAVSGNTATLQDAAAYPVNGANVYYGTDAHDTLQAACNGVGTGYLSNGTLTFSGMALISRGVDCNSAGLHFVGRSQFGMASAIVYAGKTPNPPPSYVYANPPNFVYPTAYILNLAYGGGARIERLHLIGNSQAMPEGLVISFGANGQAQGAGSGNWIGQMNWVTQMVFGSMWGDPIMSLDIPRLQSCILFAGFMGNADFSSFDNIYCYGADIGMDSVNNQAVGLRIGQWHSQYSNYGLSFSGSMDVEGYYTEFNRVDFTVGSPKWDGGMPNWGVHFLSYGGETSAMEFESRFNAYSIDCDRCNLGGWQAFYGRPDDVSADFTKFNAGQINWGNVIAGIRGKVILPYIACGASGAFGGAGFNFQSLSNDQIKWSGLYDNQSCAGAVGNGFLKIRSFAGYDPDPARTVFVDNPGTHSSTFSNMGDWIPFNGPNAGKVPEMLDTNLSQVHVGSLSVQAPVWGRGAGIGYGNTIAQAGATGSTTYNYRLTCSDSLAQESLPIPFMYYGTTPSISTGASTLTGTDFNYLQLQYAREGCANYNLYGDSGVGGCIGYLHSWTARELLQAANYIADKGAWTKDCGRIAPAVQGMGSVLLEGQLRLKSLPGVPMLGTDQQGNVGPGSMRLPSMPNLPSLGTDAQGNFTEGTDHPTTAGIAIYTPQIIQGGGSNQVGSSAYSSPAGTVISTAFTPVASSTVSDMHLQVGAYSPAPTDKVYGAIYDSDGTSATDGSSGAPGTVLCHDEVGVTITAANTWLTLPGAMLGNCPQFQVGHKYFFAFMAPGPMVWRYDTSPFDGTAYGSTMTLPWPNHASQQNGSGHYSMYVNLRNLTGGWGPSFNSSNLVPANYLGTGTTGTGTNCLTDTSVWAPCAAGTGPGNMVYPGPGIVSSNGSTWNPSYNTTTNQIPANYVAGTIGNAATATQLAGSPNQCTGGQFATGITANGTANCAPLPSTGGGVSDTPLYKRVFTNIPITADNSTLNLNQGGIAPECNLPPNGFCTMVTPPVDGTYRFTYQLSQITPGSGGTCNAGGITVFLSWTDADSNVAVSGNGRAVTVGGSVAPIGQLFVNGGANSSTTVFVAVPMEIRLKAGVPFQFRLTPGPPTNCTTPPVITFRPALYGPLGY